MCCTDETFAVACLALGWSWWISTVCGKSYEVFFSIQNQGCALKPKESVGRHSIYYCLVQPAWHQQWSHSMTKEKNESLFIGISFSGFQKNKKPHKYFSLASLNFSLFIKEPYVTFNLRLTVCISKCQCFAWSLHQGYIFKCSVINALTQGLDLSSFPFITGRQHLDVELVESFKDINFKFI